MTAPPLDVSVVVIVSERSEPFAEFYREYAEPLRAGGISFEFIFVVPASGQALLEPLIPLRASGEPIVLFESAENVGEAGLLRSVLTHCSGEVVLVLAAYRRVAASALPLLLQAIDDGADLVVARRTAAGDRAANQVQRRLVHGLVRVLVGDRVTVELSPVDQSRGRITRRLG